MVAISASTCAFFGSFSDASCKRASALVVSPRSRSSDASFKRRSAADNADVDEESVGAGVARGFNVGGGAGVTRGGVTAAARGAVTAVTFGLAAGRLAPIR